MTTKTHTIQIQSVNIELVRALAIYKRGGVGILVTQLHLVSAVNH